MIPEGWKPYDFGELASKIEGGGTPSRKSPEYWNGSIPWATVKDLTATKLCGTEEGISEAGLANSSSKLIPSGTMIIATRMALGKAVVFDRDVSINQDLKAVYPKSNVEPSFLHHWYISRASYIEALGTGSTVKGIRLDDLKFLAVQLPPLPEQKKIAAILTSVDEAIEKQEAQIAKLQDLKKAMMQELLTQGIGHTEFKDSPVGRIPKGWKVGRFDSFATLQRGFDLPVQCRIAGNYPIVGSNGIVGYHNEAKVRAQGVVTGRSGSLGDVLYIECDHWPLNTALYIKDFHGNDPKYVFYFISNFRLEKYGTGTGVPTLNRNNVHKVLIAFPVIEEQQKIAAILTSVDNNIEAKQKKLAHTKSLKKALMQDLLTGKVRVKV